MASILTPLQLTVIAELLQDQGIKSLPTALTSAVTGYTSTALGTAYASALAAYKSASFRTDSTLESLLKIGATVCPALGNSVPEPAIGSYPYLLNEYIDTNTDPLGFAGLIQQIGEAYLGVNNAPQFAQGFAAVESYITTTNQVINSSVNANTYLGPTFTNMNDLTTDAITSVNSDITTFGVDLARQGNLWQLDKIDLYGTPAGLLQSIAKQGKLQGGASIDSIQTRLLAAGLTKAEIADLVLNNQYSLFNQTGLSEGDFNKLQKTAYSAMADIAGTDLQEILDILDVTTPNITKLADLFDPTKTFPLSYSTLLVPGPDGPIPIYDANGAVQSDVAPIVDATLPTATGCEELGKIIPPGNAIANKAIQSSLQQIGGIRNTTQPKLANVINGGTDRLWDPTEEYLENSIVSDGATVPNNYLAIQEVPAGTNLSNTAYWQPYNLGALNTMDDLTDIAAQTTAVDASVQTAIDTTLATGSGPNGEITTYDVLGTAIDYNNLTTQLTSATAVITSLGAALNTLIGYYNAIAAAGNDATVITNIANANSEISTLAGTYPTQVANLNTYWTTMAGYLNAEAQYQYNAGINYFLAADSGQTSVYSFAQSLPAYGRDTAAQQACEFLEAIADTTTLGGQAIVGAMREARNSDRLQAANLLTTANQIPADPPLLPIPVVLPVN